jgi:hypothetical protein
MSCSSCVEPAAGLFERQLVLARVDGADELVALASSSARRTSNRAVSSASSSCARCTSRSAFIFTMPCSASAISVPACSSAYC